jgi:hypothetical protein
VAYEVWPDHDPSEILEYGFDWIDRLDAGDTVASSTWEIASGSVTKDPAGKPASDDLIADDTIVKVWLEGGTAGETCLVTNHIITAAGRHRDRTAKLKIKAK